MMAQVRTVFGDVPVDSLGVTYYHEHTISRPPSDYHQGDPDLVLDSVDAIVQELLEFKSIGGTCMVDASAIDYGRDVPRTAEAARRSGVHVVLTSGFNKAAYFTDAIKAASLEGLEQQIWQEATEGIDGTDHRPGQLKFGSSYHHMTPDEERAARAVCRVQRRTALPLFTHTEAGTYALEQIALLKEEGVDLPRVCIGHMDRNPDLWYIRQVLRQGVFIGIDQISKVKYFTDQVRIDLIIALIRAGYQQRLLLSGDLARRSYLRAYGGGPGFRYIATRFVPRLVEEMLEQGFTPSQAEQARQDLLVQNPLRYLSIA